MNSRAAFGALQRTSGLAAASLGAAQKKAYAAGQKMAQAEKLHAQQSLPAQMHAMALARSAYHDTIDAEAFKYRAAFLILSKEERAKALAASLDASKPQDIRTKRALVEAASRNEERADLLEQAAKAAHAAVNEVPEPEAVSSRRVDALALRLGFDLSKDPAHKEVPISNTVMAPKYINPLMRDFYPEDMRRAAGALSGLGDEALPSSPSWLDSIKTAFGVGVSAAGNAAIAEGQRTVQSNPGAGVAISSAGGLLSSIASALGIQSTRGYQGKPPPVGEFPWAPIVGVGAAVAGGVLLWRILR